MIITKDTKIYGSFAERAGNNGCRMFNTAFEYYRIDAIYRSFSVDNIEKAVESARILNFSGFAITMPFKKEVLKYVDELSPEVKEIGAANTVVNTNGILKAYNTDYYAAKSDVKGWCENFYDKMVYVLGNGGYSAAVQQAFKDLNMEMKLITRSNWHEIKDIDMTLIYNCTPVSNLKDIIKDSNIFIDCLIDTPSGQHLSLLQAGHQFRLYTGLEFPFK